MINYFNFKRMGEKFLLTNDFGRYIFLSAEEFRNLYIENLDNEEIKKHIEEAGFWFETSENFFTENNKFQLREAKNYLFQSTQLHIFVVTTACNMKCVYCQAQNGKTLSNGYMTKEIAKKSVEIALQSPSKNLQFEFQGGEPLLNFEIIKYIVEYTKENARNKNIQYSLVSNLTILTEEILEFLCENNIGISTSVDGDLFLHNANRPLKTGGETFEIVKDKIFYIQSKGIYVGAIQTTTKESLDKYIQIIDTYKELGFDNILLRPLTPLGCAEKNWNEIGYTAEEFVDFYKKAFRYLIEINKKGYKMKEGIAAVFLKKILQGYSENYMELRSPCGAAMGQMAYYYNGNVYTCDEGRMLAEMGNSAFCLGSALKNDYNELMDSRVCKAACSASILESLPSCSDCVYQPYCGVCPVVNFALYGDTYERQPNGYRCTINKGILDIIFSYLKDNDESIINILRSWI